MRYLLLRSVAALACLGVFSPSQTSAAPKPDQPDKPNLSGAWMLDLKASTSVEPLMKQIGAGLLERKYATSTKLKATFHQTEQVLTIATRGPGFALDETLYLDGRTDPSNQQLLGATALKTRTAWSEPRSGSEHQCSHPSVLSPKYEVFCSDQNGPPARREEGAYLNRYVTDEQRSRRPIFIATLWAGASWLFFRVARSTRMTKIWALLRQSGSDRLEKQPTDLRQNTSYFGDRTLEQLPGLPRVGEKEIVLGQ